MPFEDDMAIDAVAAEIQVWLNAGWTWLASIRVEDPSPGNVVIFDGSGLDFHDRLAFLVMEERIPQPPSDADD